MSDEFNFYPDMALLSEVYDELTAREQTQWAEEKVIEEERQWGCSQYEDYLDDAREWEDSEMHKREKERLTMLVNRIHEMLAPYVDKDIWDESIWNDRSVRDVYTLNLSFSQDYTHFLASMNLELKNWGDFGPPYEGKKNYDTVGGEMVGRLTHEMEYDELLQNLEQLLLAIDKYLL